ncbi:NAD(P)-binding protein [Lentinula boryana]|uniref:NAD(P)-binding protein n=1 Tax=Lentinula boryana TaxID=40481 RepID=A0ABQ8QQJ4_9AGAR|nr:NAD(P)-binding protein [Lentinula boryana]
MSTKKLILVIGATGIQGRPCVSALLAPQDDGTPSLYSVRVLTRDPTSQQAQGLASLGAELFKGSFEDLETVVVAFEGCYGVFVNTDTFSVGEQKEIYLGIKMFELAHRAPQMRHFIWSGLDYGSKYGNFDPKYIAVQLDGKGIVSDFLRSQQSSPSGDSLTWSIITTGPYIENLGGVLMGPLAERENGAVVFALPVGDGHVPSISLEDIGWWVRYTFDHRSETSGQELKIATEMLTIDQLVETFTRVTGIPAIRKRMSVEEYLDRYPHTARSMMKGEKGPSIKENFAGMFRVWGDDLLTRDMEWIRRVHPTGYTLESWIKEKGYDGTLSPDLILFSSKR